MQRNSSRLIAKAASESVAGDFFCPLRSPCTQIIELRKNCKLPRKMVTSTSSAHCWKTKDWGKTSIHFQRRTRYFVGFSAKESVTLVFQDRRTALHVAAIHNRLEIVKVLIDARSSVNCQDHVCLSFSSGLLIASQFLHTPLMFAAFGGHFQIAEELLKRNAAVDNVNGVRFHSLSTMHYSFSKKSFPKFRWSKFQKRIWAFVCTNFIFLYSPNAVGKHCVAICLWLQPCWYCATASEIFSKHDQAQR